MSVKVSDRPGTLAGHDIVLSISEEAVNAQLEKLYRTPITRGPLPKPSKTPGFSPTPQSRHLINHSLSIHRLVEDDDGEMVKAQDGIDGYIECPRIRFRSRDDDPEKTYRYAYIELTFKRDDDDKKDSLLHYWAFKSSGPGLKHHVINGYTLSWQVHVAQEEVQNVMEDLLNASTDENDQTTLPDRAAKQLAKIDSKIFTVSSIFCLFQATRISNSFKVRGPDGVALGLDAQDMVNSFSQSISTYFSLLQENQKIKGAPTVDNPFVLGYSISQKLPDIRDIDYEASTDHTPVYFQPKQWSLSTTPGKVDAESGLKATSGTLNYCMFTHRKGQDDGPIVVDPSDRNAGVFADTFFDVTKSFGKTKDSHGVTQGYDGIMAFSKEIFSDWWLRDLARSMLVDPNLKHRWSIGVAIGESDPSFGLDPEQSYSVKGQGLGVSRTWSLPRDLFQYYRFPTPFIIRKRIRGSSVVEITYTSETESIKDLEHGIDHSRKVYLDIVIEHNLNYNLALSHDGHLSAETDQVNWEPLSMINLRTRSLARVEIFSGSAGKWSIRLDEARSKNLLKDGEAPDWVHLHVQNEDFVNSVQSEDHIPPNGEIYHRDRLRFLRSITYWKRNTAATLQNGLTSGFKELGNKIIMPAGNVFMFAGLGTDSKGNLYAQVSYSNEGGVKVDQVKSS